MVEVICDTSFLIHISTKRIKNIFNLDTEIGQIQFVVPKIVIDELNKLCSNKNKNQDAQSALEFIKKLKKISIDGTVADDAIIFHVKNKGGIIATMDKELKNRVKNSGGSILSVSNNKIVLES